MDEVVVYSEKVKERIIRIKMKQDNVCRDMIDIGNDLIQIKNELNHGQWIQCLEKDLMYSRQTAKRLMQIAREFGGANGSTSSHLTSSKIIELLSLPFDSRDDFLKKNECKVDEFTVKQLREEIAKYKHDNDLMTEKQKKAYEDKRHAEDEAKQLQLELQREKSKPAKIVEKVVEKVVDKTDYTIISKIGEYEDKITHLEDKISVLNEREEINETLMNDCKREVEEYKQFKERLLGMQSVSGGDYDEVIILKQIDDLYVNIDALIRNELAPIKYNGCIRFINNSQYINDSFNALIVTVQEWCDDMRNELNNNKNIITVEVK